MAGFTKKGWIAVGQWVECVDDNVPDICNCDPASMEQDGRSYDEACANARLISTAPEMLRLLRRILLEDRVQKMFTNKDFLSAEVTKSAKEVFKFVKGNGK